METHDQRLALEESVVLEPARGGGGRGERCNYSSVNRERGGADQVRRVWLTSLPVISPIYSEEQPRSTETSWMECDSRLFELA
jgi:hypothetical protein